MKKYVLALVIAASLYFGYGDVSQAVKHRHRTHAPVTVQEAATHLIGLGKRPGQMAAGCTATAIAPHVLLTAEHCDPDDKFSYIRVDSSMFDYQIQMTCADGHDHLLIAVDGPEFRNIAPYVPRSARIGEPVHYWGDGMGTFPAELKTGKVVDEFDPSDVDEDLGAFYTNLDSVHGDSGSAIYGADGDILGLVTYGGIDDEASNENFVMAFTPEQIEFAKNFVPKPREEAAPKPEPKINPLDIFGSIFGR